MVKPWQYTPAPPPRRIGTAAAEPLSASQEAELLHRHRLGYMDKTAHRRLSKLFTDAPADITQRLTRACEHLGVTGEYVDLYTQAVDHAEALEHLWVRVEAGEWPINNADVLRSYLERARGGDGEALEPVLVYLLHPTVAAELCIHS